MVYYMLFFLRQNYRQTLHGLPFPAAPAAVHEAGTSGGTTRGAGGKPVQGDT